MNVHKDFFIIVWRKSSITFDFGSTNSLVISILTVLIILIIRLLEKR